MSKVDFFNRLRHGIHKRFVTPRSIAKLCGHKKSIVRVVGTALRGYKRGDLSADELQWIEKIEKARRGLCRSTERLVVPDYGAGSPSEAVRGQLREDVPIVTENVGQACRNYSKSREWATLLFQLVRHLKPSNCIELGTCLGISACYQTAALELNGKGRFTTLEGALAFAHIARHNLEALGLADRASVVVGRFQDNLYSVLQRDKVDYAFIDGHHNEQAAIGYYQRLLPHLANSALIIFDDICWSPGMRRAWKNIRQHTRVDISIDLDSVGLCLMGAGEKGHHEVVLV
jgi:predicted O-methyltransferase YrrM